MLTLDSFAVFTWNFGEHFFLKADCGNFIWSDPEYGGDNTIVPFDGDYHMWCRQEKIPFGRCKGTHMIRQYCGPNVKLPGESVEE